MSGYDPQAIIDSYTEHDEISRVLVPATWRRETVEKAGPRVLEMAGTPTIAASLGSELDKARQSPDAWAYVVEMEKKACTVPGLLDTGGHIIAVALRD